MGKGEGGRLGEGDIHTYIEEERDRQRKIKKQTDRLTNGQGGTD